MAKRARLEILYDILKILGSNKNPMKPTPLLRKSNLSTARFKEYFTEMTEKEFIKETNIFGERRISITEKGLQFLEKYSTIKNFIEEFDL